MSAKKFRGRAAEKASLTWRSLGRFLVFSLLHQFQQFGNDVSPSNLSNQIPKFLVLLRVLGLPVEAIHPINVSQLSLQIF